MSTATHLARDEDLYRYINPLFLNDAGIVSSQAFTDERMSVDRARMCLRPLPIKPDWQTAQLNTGDVNDLGFDVIADPLPSNAAHALIPGKKTKSQARTLARLAKMLPTTASTAKADTTPPVGHTAVDTNRHR